MKAVAPKVTPSVLTLRDVRQRIAAMEILVRAGEATAKDATELVRLKAGLRRLETFRSAR